MSDYQEYYKKAWELGLMERNTYLKIHKERFLDLLNEAEAKGAKQAEGKLAIAVEALSDIADCNDALNPLYLDEPHSAQAAREALAKIRGDG